MDPVETTGHQPLVHRLDRELVLFKLLQRHQPMLRLTDPRDLPVASPPMGRKINTCLSFRPIDLGSVRRSVHGATVAGEGARVVRRSSELCDEKRARR